jgi:hypothetical protein
LQFLANDLESISVMGDIHVACQEYRKRAAGQPAGDVIPTYRTSKFVKSGVAAANTCGKFKAEAKPGELILFVRSMSFWQKFKL